jgi:hypothetical protein
MIVRRFACENDKDYGGKGFKPLWVPNANAFQGMTCAHDILEHTADDPGPAEGECMAMGACVYVRGLNGWFYENLPGNVNTPATHLAGTLMGTMRDTRHNGDLADPGRTRRIRTEPYAEDLIQEALIQARKDFAVEYQGDVEPLTCEEMRRIEGWMRLGYRLAVRRYGVIGESEVGYLFTRIGRRIDELLKRADEGMELVVRVKVHECNFRADLDYPKDPYGYD